MDDVAPPVGFSGSTIGRCVKSRQISGSSKGESEEISDYFPELWDIICKDPCNLLCEWKFNCFQSSWDTPTISGRKKRGSPNPHLKDCDVVSPHHLKYHNTTEKGRCGVPLRLSISSQYQVVGFTCAKKSKIINFYQRTGPVYPGILGSTVKLNKCFLCWSLGTLRRRMVPLKNLQKWEKSSDSHMAKSMKWDEFVSFQLLRGSIPSPSRSRASSIGIFIPRISWNFKMNELHAKKYRKSIRNP